MLGVLLPVGGAAALLGLGGWLWWRSRHEGLYEPSPETISATSSALSSARAPAPRGGPLERGRAYDVVLQLERAPEGTSGQDVQKRLRALLESLGFALLVPPQPENEQAATDFASGQPSRWILRARWTRSEGTFPAPRVPILSRVILTPAS